MRESASGEADASTEPADKSVCPTCGDTFGSTGGMKNHHYLVHGEKLPSGVEVTCDGCGEAFRKRRRDAKASDRDFCSIECQGKCYENEVEYPRLDDPEWLRERYINKGKTAAEIASEVGCAKSTTFAHLHEHGIYKNQETANRYPELEDEQLLRDWYESEDLFMTDIAERIGCHVSAVAKALTRHGVEHSHPTNQNHPNWRGGHSEYYGPNWSEARDACRERDAYTCQDCGLSESETDTELDVHHRVPLSTFKREYDEPEWWEKGNRLENLVALCNDCHMKWEYAPFVPDFGTE